MVDREDEARLFHEGVALFNAGEWFEAHEVWEDIWRMASGPKKHFYQGLIQVAVTIEHMRRGNPRGVLSVWTTAQEKFRGIDDVYMGIDVPALLSAVRAMVEPIRRLPAEMFSPARGRGLDLPVDLSQAPRITLQWDPFAEEQERQTGQVEG